MGAPLQFRVLGRVEVLDRAGAAIPLGGPKRQAILARLLIDANRAVPFERLVHDLWDGEPTPGAPATLQSHISRVRRLVGADRLRTVDGGYLLEVGDGELDAAVGEAELATGRQLIAERKTREAAAVLETALKRWTGPPFGELRYAEWATAEAGRLDDVRLQIVEALLGARLTLGESADVAARSEKEIALHPLRERLWALLIEALYRDGRQADALRAYQRLRATLVEELGIEPSPELQALEQQVLAQDLAARPTPPPVTPSLPTGVVSFLLTDVVGSTRLWETAPDSMPFALGRHDEIMADAVATHDGALLKARGEGDSTFSVFQRATDAVAAAHAAQTALAAERWPPDCTITVRMALHTGEALERDGDYYGRTVNRVARLRAIAEPGELLLSRAVADVTADHLPEGVTLVEMGLRELRDLDRPEMVYRLEAAFGGPPSPRGEPSPALRRAHVTAVFVHLEDTGDADGGFDPESARALLGRYHAAVHDEVTARRGHVVRMASDGVLAVFGVPDVSEDDAERAVIAADAILTAARKLSTELAVAVGIEAGEVVVEGDDMVGDPVRLAPRLAAAADPGEAFVGEAAWRLTRHMARFERTEPLELRTRATPLAAYRLLAASPPVDSAATSFVGRDAELATLVSLFDTSIDRQATRLATVIGSPGVGKTRLVNELCAALEERATILATRCDPAGGATYAPVADLIGDIGALDDLLRDDRERERVMAVVDGLVGGGSPGTPEETFWAVRRLIESAAKRHPVLVLLDDVHWAEPLLLDLVEHLGEWMSESPVLLVVVARPELRELRPALAEPAGRTGTVIALEGLDAGATRRLACELLGTDDAPEQLLTTLVPSTDGNPLFVRELVRMLVDDGILRPEDDSWQLTVDATEIDVPPTIQALLAARVDRLNADERQVLERAAVIGTEVYRGLLGELMPSELQARLDGLLEALRRKELLEPAGSYWIDERVLRFHHVLIRDAAYRRLLREARADLHERCARWIDGKTGGGVEHDELIGYHLEQSQANLRKLGPLDENGRDVANEAAVRLASAARRALDRDDLAAAAVLAERGLACLDGHDPRRAELLIVRCEALLGTGDVAAASPAIGELANHSDDDPRLDAWATCFSVQRAVLVDPRTIGDSEAGVIEAAERLAALGDPAGAAKAHRVHASVLARLGRVGDCEAALDRALSAARNADDRRQITGVLSVAPLAALWGPSPVPRAGGRCLDVIRLVRITTGAIAVEAISIRCQAVLEGLRGRFDAARSMLATARATAEDLGLRHGLLEVEQFAGIIELCAGDPKAADEHLRIAYDGLRAMGVDADAAQSAALRARAALAAGRHDDALAFAATSEELGGQDLKTAIAWRTVRAQVLAARGAIGAATELVEAAVALAERTDALVDHADACAALAAVKRAAGDEGSATVAADRARALYEQKGATALAARIETPAESRRVAATPRAAEATLENLATGTWNRVVRLIESGDIAGVLPLYRENFYAEDHRPGFTSRTDGAAAHMRSLQIGHGLGPHRVETTGIAVRGERAALIGCRWIGQAFEIEILAAITVDEAGLMEAMIVFEPGDLIPAVAKLDELYAAREGAPCAATIRVMSDVIVAIDRRDWPAIDALYEATYAMLDRRPASFGEVRDVRVSELVQQLIDGSSGFGYYMRRVIGVSDRCILGETVAIATVQGDTPYDIVFLMLAVVSGAGRIECTELFDLDQIDQAWARYREVANETSLDNDATRVFRRLAEVVAAGQIDDAAALLAAEYVDEDRRFGLHNRNERETVIEQYRIAAQLGARPLRSDVVALRGDRLALMRSVFGNDQFEAEALMVFGTDSGGLASFAVLFDPGAVVDALEELDHRFADGEGAAHARCVRVVSGVVAAHNRRDWEGLRGFVAEDMIFVDHRRASHGEIRGIDPFVDANLVMIELDPTCVQVLRRIVAVDDRLHLAESTPITTGPAGSVYERPRLILTVLRTPDGPIESWEFFEPEQDDLALARFRELSKGSRLENAATRLFARMSQALSDQRWDDYRSLFAAGHVDDDRRAGLHHRVEGGRKQFAGIHQATTVDAEVIAIRGERLGLIRAVYSIRGFEVELLVLAGLDEQGRLEYSVLFDVDAMGDALAELDDRYARGEGAAHARCVRVVSGVVAARNQRDWDGMRRFAADDVVIVDHRPASLGEIHGLDRFMELSRAMVDLAPTYCQVLRRIVAIDDLCLLAENTRITGATENSSYERSRLILTALRTPDGPIERWEFFDPEQIDQALDRYRELTAAIALENASTRAWRRGADLAFAERYDELRDTFSAKYQMIDRRRGLGAQVEGPDKAVENMRTSIEMGVRRVDAEIVAIRGDRLALVKGRYSGAAFEVDILVVNGIDADGMSELAVLFDPDDMASAIAELDERYIAGEAAPHADALRRFVDVWSAYNDRDWLRLRQLYDDDVVALDHRRAGYGEQQGADALVQRHQTMVELAPGYLILARRILALDDFCMLSDTVAIAPDGKGTSYDMPRLIISKVRAAARLVDRFEYFDPDQLDLAWARYRELSHADDNAALRTERLRGTAVINGEWDRLAALLHPDAVIDDRRIDIQNRVEGREATIEWFRQAQAAGIDDIGYEPLGMRGEQLVLFRMVLSSKDFEITGLVLDETDDQFRMRRLVVFDNDDVDAAIAELEARANAISSRLENAASRHYDADDLDAAPAERDARYVAGEGLENAAVRTIRAWTGRARATNDWSPVEGMLSPGFEFDDRRVGLQTRIDSDVAALESLPNMTSFGVDDMSFEPIALRGERLALFRLVPTYEGFEMPQLLVHEDDDAGRAKSETVFDLDAVPEAIAFLDERYAAGEGAAIARVAGPCSEMFQANLAGDWPRLRSYYADDIVAVDHRPASFGEIRNADQLLERGRSWTELAPGTSHYLRRYLGVEGRAILVEVAHADIGAPPSQRYESIKLVAARLNERGQVDRYDTFVVEDLDAARARFHELVAEDALGSPENAATRTWLAVDAAIVAREFDGVAPLLAESCYADDRRTGLSNRVDGPEAIVDQARSIAALGVHGIDTAVLAVRGERVSLIHDTYIGKAFEVAALYVNEVDDEGRGVASVCFYPEQLDEALTELEARFLSGEGAAHASWLGTSLLALEVAHLRRDWDAVRAVYADDVVAVDLRPAGAGELRGVDAILDYNRVMVELAPSHRHVVRRVVAIAERAVLCEVHSRDVGGSHEIASLFVLRVDDDDRIIRIEQFSVDDLERARARFDELSATQPRDAM